MTAQLSFSAHLHLLITGMKVIGAAGACVVLSWRTTVDDAGTKQQLFGLYSVDIVDSY